MLDLKGLLAAGFVLTTAMSGKCCLGLKRKAETQLQKWVD